MSWVGPSRIGDLRERQTCERVVNWKTKNVTLCYRLIDRQVILFHEFHWLHQFRIIDSTYRPNLLIIHQLRTVVIPANFLDPEKSLHCCQYCVSNSHTSESRKHSYQWTCDLACFIGLRLLTYIIPIRPTLLINKNQQTFTLFPMSHFDCIYLSSRFSIIYFDYKLAR